MKSPIPVTDGPLTPIIRIDTKVPAPNRPFESVNSDPGQLFGDGNKTIILSACSEFVNEPTTLRQLDGSHKLRIIEDASSQPAIFTCGSNNRLYCTVHVEGGRTGWHTVDITPLPEARGGVTTFDVMKTIDKRVVICTAFMDLSGELAVYHCTIENFSCSWNPQSLSLRGLDPSKLPWKRIENNLGPKPICNLNLASSPLSSPPFQIVAVTQSFENHVASHFVLDPTFNAELAWRSVRVGASVSVIRDCYPANLHTGRGLFTLFDYPSGSSGCVFDSWDGTFHYKMRLDDFGNIRSIFPNQNPWNMTDLMVATERGIAFVNFASPDLPPQFFLTGIPMKQVVSYEVVDAGAPDIQTRLAIFALSDTNELYYVEAWRPYTSNILRFRLSALPIANDVDKISTQYNAAHDATELVYISDGNDEIYHLARTPVGWAQNRIMIQHATADVEIVKVPAYITALTLSKDDAGTTVGGDYPLQLSCDHLVRVQVNGRSRTVGPTPETFMTDSEGRIRIVAFTDASLVGPEYTLTLTKFTTQPRMFPIHSAQRVLRIMAKIDSMDALANARSTDGRVVFNTADPRLGESSVLLTNFHAMLTAVDPGGAGQILDGIDKPKGAGNFTVGYTRTGDGNIEKDAGTWIDKAVDALDHVVADVMAFIRKAIKTVVKFAIRVVGPVVTFFFKAAGKAIKFVAKRAWTLLQGVAHFLDQYLGTHIDDFLNWLSFIFDVERTKESQKVLLETLSLGRELVDAQMHHWGDSIESAVEEARNTMMKRIKDQRAPLQPGGDKLTSALKSSSMFKSLEFFFNNPIMSTIQKYNPLNIFMDAIEGGISDALVETGTNINLTEDSVWTKILGILAEFFIQEGENIMRLFEDLKTRITSIVTDFNKAKVEANAILGDAFWTFFDSIKILVVQLWKLLTALIDGILDLVAQELPVPIINELWKDFAEQPFTIVNIFTYVGALVMNIVSISLNGKLPFEAWGDPRQTMRDVVANTKALEKQGVSASLKEEGFQTNLPTSAQQLDPSGASPQSVPKDASEEILQAEADKIWSQTSNAVNFLTTGATLISTLLGCLTIANEKGAESAQQMINEDMNRMYKTQGEDFFLGSQYQEILRRKRDNKVSFKGIEYGIQNAQFVMDVFQIVPRCVSLGIYDDLLRTNTPFKKSQGALIDHNRGSQWTMLVTAIMDCGARGLVTSVSRGTIPSPNPVTNKIAFIKAGGTSKADALCDWVAAINCLANAIGSGISMTDSGTDKRSRTMNGLGMGTSVALTLANITSGGMKFSSNYNPYAYAFMWFNLGSSSVLGIGQVMAEVMIVETGTGS